MLGRRETLLLAVAIGTLSSLFMALPAQAQFVFSPTFSYREDKTETSAGTSDRKETVFNFRMLYQLGGGLAVGGLYGIDTIDSGGGSTEKATAYGPSIGYLPQGAGFNLVGTYLVFAERENKSSSSTTMYKDGKGLQIDAGYAMTVGSFGLGPQLTWRSIEYKKVQVNGGTDSSTSLKRTEIRPMIALFFHF